MNFFHFEVQNFPKLARGKLVKLMPVSFWLAFISFLWISLLSGTKVSFGFTCTFPASVIELANSPRRSFSGEWHLETKIQVLSENLATGIFLLLGYFRGCSYLYIQTRIHKPMCTHTGTQHKPLNTSEFLLLLPPFLVCISFPPTVRRPLVSTPATSMTDLPNATITLDTFGLVITNLLSIAPDCFLNFLCP